MIYKTHKTDAAKLNTIEELILAWTGEARYFARETARAKREGVKIHGRTRTAHASWTAALRAREAKLVDQLCNQAWGDLQVAREGFDAKAIELAEDRLDLADALFAHVYQGQLYSEEVAGMARETAAVRASITSA